MSRPTKAELTELRRMLAELDEVQYTARTYRDLKPGERRYAGCCREQEYGLRSNETNTEGIMGHGNAPVYADIIGQFSPPDSAADLRRLLTAHLNGGRKTVWFDRALYVARLRMEGSREVSAPILPPDAGLTLAEIFKQEQRAFNRAIETLARQERLLPRYVKLMETQCRQPIAYFGGYHAQP